MDKYILSAGKFIESITISFALAFSFIAAYGGLTFYMTGAFEPTHTEVKVLNVCAWVAVLVGVSIGSFRSYRFYKIYSQANQLFD